jgi:integrase
MTDQPTTWSRKKKDPAPRGVFLHPSATPKVRIWAIRYYCALGHRHKEKIGPIKTAATNAHHDRRARVRREPGWCPAAERRQARAHALTRVTLRTYSTDYLAWAKDHKRSWTKDRSRLSRILPALGDRKLDEITTADLERFLATLRQGERAVTGATVNRSRDLLSGMFKRAVRLGLLATNPVKGIPKLKEPGGRIVYLPPAAPGYPAYEENTLHEALDSELRPLFAVSINTGLRWSEQIRLRWRDADLLARTISVPASKNGLGRRLPMNSVVRSVLVDVGARRMRPNDPDEPIFTAAYRTLARAFADAVERAQAALRDQGRDASRLDGYTWHGNRHTFASRLVMAGVDLLTVKELGGWKTLSMVQRYAHLAPGHLIAAVERIVVPNSIAAVEESGKKAAPVGVVAG